MKNASYQRKTCRLCESTQLDLVIPIAATPPGDRYAQQKDLGVVQEKYPLDVYLCRECGLLQLLYVVDPDILYGNYLYTTSVSLGLNEHFKNTVRQIVDFVQPEPSSLVVDIGSNDGTALRFYKEMGMRVVGVDPAVDIAKQATANGIPTLNGFFDQAMADKIRAQHGVATILTANNVSANIDDWQGYIEAVSSLMGPDSVYIFETGYGVDVARNMLLDVIFHEHLSYFSVAPLERFFRKNGLQLIQVENIQSKGGSLRGVVQKINGKRPVGESVGEMLELERSIGAHQPEMYKAFAGKIHNIKIEMTSILEKLRAAGKSIYGYGASVGGTTMLYQFELDKYLELLVDDNPVRHGLFTPGMHLAVIPSEEIQTHDPGALLVLAWRYYDSIRKRNAGYKGQYIIPLPELKVV